ncbi:YkvI family membrane protein [Falsibacillus pallidus]|uniref:Putative membrane protein YkvI n=1 Tax=Falsibacillus pallidus TaxID=493781 RepID=A0A370GWN7_9BACI|nr:GerAB/ArcD/ProY family transporter [Falsibacillus pallidus]RDI47670.1 putative membrane protein YkvI [Falsibacillus pallidus]
MKHWIQSFQIAAVYVGTVVGAGFATGKEIVEFFSRFGFIGLIGILMGGYLFVALGTKLMEKSIDIGAQSYEELNTYLFGKYFSKGMNILMMIMLLGVCAVMLAGSGAIFQEQLGYPKMAGVLLTAVLSFIVMMLGVKGLFAVNTFVVPMMIFFNLYLLMHSIQHPHFLQGLLTIPYAEDGWKSVVAPFSYTALNLALAQAVLVPVAAEVKNKKVVRRGGIIGGLLLTVILLSSHATLVMLPNVDSYEIPIAVIMKKMASEIYFIYIFIIYGEIFSSVIGNIYGLEKQIRGYLPFKSAWLYALIIAGAFSFGVINYGTLLSYLYPIFGYISLVFIILLWMKPHKNKE